MTNWTGTNGFGTIFASFEQEDGKTMHKAILLLGDKLVDVWVFDPEDKAEEAETMSKVYATIAQWRRLPFEEQIQRHSELRDSNIKIEGRDNEGL